MKPSGKTHKASLSSGLRPTQASTTPTLPFAAPRQSSTADIETQLGDSHRILSGEKARSLELRASLENKRSIVQELEHRHQANQQLIVTYEKEISRQRPMRASTNAQNQASLSVTAQALQTQMETAVATHSDHLESLTVNVLPNTHSNKVVELTLAQLALYRSQLAQSQESACSKVNSLLARVQATEEELNTLRAELREARRGRLEDVKEHQKLAREESYSLAVLSEKKAKAADQLAREAAQTVYKTLEEKLPESDFLDSLRSKLLARGVQI